MIDVLDDLLPDPMAYLAEVRRLSFGSVTFGPDTFKGIALAHRDDVDRIAETHTRASPALSFFRRSPLGQVEPNYIHCDAGMGDFTGIFYLNPEPAEGDGTAFWERSGDDWKMTRLVPARFNRLLLFTAGLHHSRALFDNYGEGDGARLIQVIFLRERPPLRSGPRVSLVRLPDWKPRLVELANRHRATPYRYGEHDCATFARDAVEAVTGTVLLPEAERQAGWLAAARFMIARGWETVEAMADELLPPVDAALSRPGDIVSFEQGGELHLAVRMGDAAVSPGLQGLFPVGGGHWHRAWKVG
ncbi:DUF6950 family protein [Reyranella sp.]|uniref:DUF6950 family protein n=1 Tax=Reyranella sp. TaxID=1929291 RepID=UPI003D12DCCF